MEFCEKCGSLLKSEKRGPGVNVFTCGCGFERIGSSGDHKETIKRNEELSVGSDIHPLAVYEHICSKCGFNKAQLISKGIWYSDEDEVQEFVCGKCGAHDRVEGIREK